MKTYVCLSSAWGEELHPDEVEKGDEVLVWHPVEAIEKHVHHPGE